MMADLLTYVGDPDDLIDIPREFWRLKLNTTTKIRVLFSLYYCQQHNLKASRKALAKHLGVSLASITNSLQHLVSLGYTTKHLHRDEGNQCWLPTTYTINDDVIRAAIEADRQARG